MLAGPVTFAAMNGVEAVIVVLSASVTKTGVASVVLLVSVHVAMGARLDVMPAQLAAA